MDRKGRKERKGMRKDLNEKDLSQTALKIAALDVRFFPLCVLRALCGENK
jgi:hypothetical protein